ncbi:MAG: hypothetical protein H0T45_07275 [Pyrinomonadaceae bacterium]|nr:hypothetical protein [Pyrinomonadaceae bacterium]
MEENTAQQAGNAGGAGAADSTRDNQAHELEAEEESAAAMDADVPQPPDASQTTEGQPS